MYRPEKNQFQKAQKLTVSLAPSHIKLESGQYMLSFRYYHTKNELKFPTIKVDGNKVIDARPIDKEWQEYQEGL